ncbi:hypothetical protein FMM05_06415 [Flavobacterium zepuense]|uniref:Uncharacterized protein n=1 Tax=Flavobacterium zepuense TaxID=2593302 RepID=A0A552V5X5_9FLAO|nr:hypothetical protein [Flavobacterium zepuense]TRW25851.1 hypothetical protein FMM05_06415 [Flavobacterium zepuense]
MKKLKMLLVVAMVAVALPGFAQRKKVAVVTFYAEKQVDLADVGLDAVTVAADLMNDPTFNLQPLLKEYHDKFFNEYAKKFPFDLVPEATVTGNAAYQSFMPEYTAGYTASSFEVIEGYKPLDHNNGKKNEEGMEKIFNDVDGIMFVYVKFALNKGFGVGGTATTKMQAYTNIVVYNKKGDKVFTINEHANSKKTGVMVGGVPVMKAEKILPMCQSALTELMEDLDKRIQKIIDKAGKKL